MRHRRSSPAQTRHSLRDGSRLCWSIVAFFRCRLKCSLLLPLLFARFIRHWRRSQTSSLPVEFKIEEAAVILEPVALAVCIVTVDDVLPISQFPVQLVPGKVIFRRDPAHRLLGADAVVVVKVARGDPVYGENLQQKDPKQH